MFGVRVMIDGQVAGLKMFETLSAAKERFRQGWSKAYDGYCDSIAIFGVVEATDVRDAAQAILKGDKDRIVLLDIQVSRDLTIANLAKKITIRL